MQLKGYDAWKTRSDLDDADRWPCDERERCFLYDSRRCPKTRPRGPSGPATASTPACATSAPPKESPMSDETTEVLMPVGGEITIDASRIGVMTSTTATPRRPARRRPPTASSST